MRHALTCLLVLTACGRSGDPVGEAPREVIVDTGWATDFEACATIREEANFAPVHLLLALDTSCSMDDGDPRKLDVVTGAFTTFFNDPDAASMNVALRLWPDPNDGCDEVTCDASACAIPQVSLGSLGDPLHRQALTDELLAVVPDGATPISAALDGAGQWAVAQMASAPGAEVAIVMITDGAPNGCDENIGNIADIAATSATAGAPVYMVGIEGSNEAQIDQIAFGGGTDQGYFVGSQNAEAQLLAALDDIRGRVLSCTFDWPTTAGDEPLSPDLVRVEYESNGETVLLDRVAGPDQCVGNGGWYLDDSVDPPVVSLCRTTCGSLQSELSLAIEVDVGCQCVVDEDCPGDQVCTDDGCLPPLGSADGVNNVLDPAQAVQGGAMNCSTTPSAPAAVLVVFALLALRREDAA